MRSHTKVRAIVLNSINASKVAIVPMIDAGKITVRKFNDIDDAWNTIKNNPEALDSFIEAIRREWHK